MGMNDWHLERAKMVLDEWYTRANQYLMLSMEYRKKWLPSVEKLCKQKTLKCKRPKLHRSFSVKSSICPLLYSSSR